MPLPPLLLAAHQVLDSSPYKWLHEMLEVFNSGDLHAYDALCTKYAAVLNGQPALVEHERRLREKVRERGGGRVVCSHHVCVCSHHAPLRFLQTLIFTDPSERSSSRISGALGSQPLQQQQRG